MPQARPFAPLDLNAMDAAHSLGEFHMLPLYRVFQVIAPGLRHLAHDASQVVETFQQVCPITDGANDVEGF